MTTLASASRAPETPASARLLRAAARAVQYAESSWLRSFALRRLVKIALDFACGVGAVVLAVGVERPPGVGSGTVVLLAAGTGAILVLSHGLGGSYQAIWRYTGMAEALVTVVASFAVLGGLALASASWLPIAPALALQVTLLTVVLCAGVRALRRWQVGWAKDDERAALSTPSPRSAHRILIIGAGEHGLSIAKDLVRAGRHRVTLVGFLDDDPAKIGAAPLGVPVLGPLAGVLPLAEQHRVSEVIVAMPSTAPEVVRGFVRYVEDAGLRVRTVGGISRFVSGVALHRPGQATEDELLRGAADPLVRSVPPGRHVLVTGGAGFIGSHLTRVLLERGYTVRLLDRFDYGRAGLEDRVGHPQLEVMAGDITSSRDLSRALKGVDGVIALAAIVGDPACNLYPEETVNLNYLATKILIDTCNFYGVRRLVFASSCSVYGASNGAHLTERSRLNPVSLYARTRVLSENLLFDRRGDVEPVVLRLATVFGLSPRMRFDLVVNTLTQRAAVNHAIAIFGGNQWRPHVHCRDAARAFIHALEAPAASVAGEVFNVGGDGSNLRIDALGELVAEIVGDVEVRHQGDVADPRDYRVSFAKIRRTLGFEPEYSIADGIREVAAAVRANALFQQLDDPLYHNVHALKQAVATPRRRRDDHPRRFVPRPGPVLSRVPAPTP